MTKEELLEDVQIGDIVKIYTESDETFEGTITDFGKSGLKITLLNSNKAKRIMYGRITEYDIEYTEANYKRKVTYTRGINFKGEIAADGSFLYSKHEKCV